MYTFWSEFRLNKLYEEFTKWKVPSFGCLLSSSLQETCLTQSHILRHSYANFIFELNTESHLLSSNSSVYFSTFFFMSCLWRNKNYKAFLLIEWTWNKFTTRTCVSFNFSLSELVGCFFVFFCFFRHFFSVQNRFLLWQIKSLNEQQSFQMLFRSCTRSPAVTSWITFQNHFIEAHY